MAAHHLTIAKAAFAASLMRPDVTKINRDDIPRFHSLFEAAVVQASSSNIQNCKQWLLEQILMSPNRTTSFSKYLTSFSKHIPQDNRKSVSRLRLHIIYLLNDLLHHTRYHLSDDVFHNNLKTSLEPFLVELFHLAASEGKERVSRHLQTVTKIWGTAEYFDKQTLDRVKDVMSTKASAPTTTQRETQVSKTSKEIPYIMPSTHGDPSMPFYDLPAGNLMPHIVPNKPIAMRAESIKALQLNSGPADEGLVNAVKDFLKDVGSLDDTYARFDDEGIVPDMDEMGQLSYRNDAGDMICDSYYGWSRAFCEKMKTRAQPGADRTTTRGRSRSYSSSRSQSPHKRRRYSNSSDGRSFSNGSYNNSRSRSRNGQRPHHRDPQTLSFRSRSRSRSYSPEAAILEKPTSYNPTPPSAMSGHAPTALPTTIPMQFEQFENRSQRFFPPPLGPGGIPLPPPRPPNWNGAWPPPPPPPPPVGVTGYPSAFSQNFPPSSGPGNFSQGMHFPQGGSQSWQNR